MSLLDQLRSQGLVEPVEVDTAAIEQWLDDADRHIAAAEAITDMDPSGAYVLAHGAARKSVAAALLRRGHRVLSRPGAHQALARFAKDLAGRQNEPSLARLDRLRRNRNRSEYGTRTFGASEVTEAISTARAISRACREIS